jgi:DNA-directed RNA polymerase specialized sigma24 family protein
VVWTTAYDVVEERMKACSLDEVEDSACAALAGPSTGSSRASRTSSPELKLMIDEAVEALAPRRRSAVRLYCLGLDHVQIAQTLSLSENQARHLLYRGLNEVKAKLKGNEESKIESKNRGKS